MPKLIFDFKCPNGHYTERFVTSSVKMVRCDTCGEEAKRVISPVRSVLEPFSGDFHDATQKWAKHHEDMAKVSEDAA